jgi:ammonium transporter Rh
MRLSWSVGKSLVLLLLTPAFAAAQNVVPGELANSVREVQQYGFAIHILAMLLVGFGFLMVFANRYGYGAVTGTYLVVAAGVPLYIALRASGVLSAESVDPHSIRALLLAEFAVASALIAAGAVPRARPPSINTRCWPA